MDASAAWNALDMGWQAAFRQAWTALCKGSFPVGAAVFAADGMLIAAGRNRIFDSGEDPLAGSLLAHAEVAVLSRLSTERRHDDVTLFTTLEPCLYCMGAVVLSRVGTVRYAGEDPYAGAAGLSLDLNEQTARFDLQLVGPLEGPFGMLGAVMPLAYLIHTGRWARVVEYSGDQSPELLHRARGLAELTEFREPSSFGFQDALEAAWGHLA